jgi:hypothetical protein
MEAELNLTSELLAGLLICCHQINPYICLLMFKNIILCWKYYDINFMSAFEVIFFASRDKLQQVRLFVPTQLYMYIISTVYSDQVWLNLKLIERTFLNL